MNFSPLSIEDCLLWLDGADITTMFTDTGGTTAVTANGQNVKCWKDKSVNGSRVANNHHATEATNPPTYSAAGGPAGLPSVAWAGGGSVILKTPAIFTANHERAVSIYCVSTGGDGTNRLIWSPTGSCWYERNGSSNSNGFHNPVQTVQGFAGVTTGTEIEGITYSGFRIRHTYARNTFRRDVLNSINNARFVNVTTPGDLGLTGAAFTIGNITGGGFGWLGTISEVIVVGRDVTEDEDRDILDYLAAKWSVGIKPYVLCVGDSLTDGSGTTAGNNGLSFPEKLQTANSGWIVERDSYPGRSLTQLMTEWRLSISWRSWRNAAAGQQAMALWIGTNDLAQSQPTATVESQYDEQVRRLIADTGMPVVCCTIIPRGDVSGTVLANIVTFNTWLKANFTGFGASAVVDLAADARLQTPSNATYFQGDTIHLTPAGNDVVVSLLQASAASALLAGAQAFVHGANPFHSSARTTRRFPQVGL